MEELEQKLPEMPETVTETVGAVEAAETAEIAGSGKVEKAAEASEIAKDTDAGETEAEKSAEDPEKAVETVYRVVDIRFRSGGKTYFFDPGELMLSPGDEVIIDTARGPEYGICSSAVHKAGEHEIVAPLRRVLRKATSADKKTAAENREKEKRAFSICQQKIAEHKLEMQLVSAECAFDGSKILFFFTAEGRVDFRDLVKNLAAIFRTRIELRQIGVRDKAKMVGGLGICGRPFCCSQFLEDFQPVSIKMAKTQNLSLNPTKISGTCGRLMCCLKYEQEAYEDLLKTAPKNESFVDTPDGRGTVTDVNLLRQTVKVRMEDQPDTIGCYRNCDICILRNGKAKKNDPPIPRDLAPISSRRRNAPAASESEEFPPLEPVIFRSDAVRAQPRQAESGKPPEGRENASSRSGRRRKKAPGDGAAQARSAGEAREQRDSGASRRKVDKASTQQAEAGTPSPQGERKPKNGSRRRYHRRKPKNPENGSSSS